MKSLCCFFAPNLYGKIDFTSEPEFLQQELYKEIIQEKKGRNTADQIVKVSLKSGKEKWVLIHIEVQDKASAGFSKRMFRYFYCIYDKFDREVYAIALLTGDNESNHPDHFHYSFYGTKIYYTYNTYKFHDHSIEELEKSSNPFALAVIAGKYSSKCKNDTENRFYFKRKLMKQVIKRFPSQQEKSRTYLTALFYFIDYLLQTPEDLESKLKDELTEFIGREGGQQMQAEKEELSPTLAGIFERLEKKGVEKGLEKGIEKGKKEGFQQAKMNFAEKLIKESFSDEKIVELTGLNQDEVMALRKSLHE